MVLRDLSCNSVQISKHATYRGSENTSYIVSQKVATETNCDGRSVAGANKTQLRMSPKSRSKTESESESTNRESVIEAKSKSKSEATLKSSKSKTKTKSTMAVARRSRLRSHTSIGGCSLRSRTFYTKLQKTKALYIRTLPTSSK